MIKISAKTPTADNTIPAIHMRSGKAKDVFISADSVITYTISPDDMKYEEYDTAIITGGELYIIRSVDIEK